MEDYHTISLALLVFMQFNILDSISTLVCLCMKLGSSWVFPFLLGNTPLDFFGAAMVYELSFLIISAFLPDSKIRTLIVITCIVSFSYNMLGYCLPVGYWYNLYSEYYQTISFILFELLVCAAFMQSILYQKLILISTRLKEKYNNV